MVKTAIAFLCACLCVLNQTTLPDWGWFVVYLILLFVSLYKRQWIIMAFLVGTLWTSYVIYLGLAERLPPDQHGKEVLLSGIIISLPEQQHKLSFLFSPDDPAFPRKIQLSWYRDYPTIKAGERWQFLVKIKTPRGLKNPAGFDYETWLFSNHIGATGYIKNSIQNKKLSPGSLFYYQTWRQTLSDKLKTLLNESDTLPLILGLTIGERQYLTDIHWETLRKTGTNHLLAISGLHIGLAALCVFFIFRKLWSSSGYLALCLPAPQAAAIAAIIAAMLYALLAGMSIPTQRALIMTTNMLVGLVWCRRYYMQDLLAMSLILILIVDPFAALSAGFWLSFSAVAIILISSTNHFPEPKFQWAKIHLWITFGLAPLGLLFFSQTAFIAPVANLIAVPIVSLIVVPIVLVASVLLGINETLAVFVFHVADFILHYLWLFLSYLGENFPLLWKQPALPFSIITLSIISLLILLIPKGLPYRWLALFGLFPAINYSPTKPEQGSFLLTILDVGQGSASVIETRHHSLVFDTGRAFSKNFNTGSSIIAPYLQSRHIDEIDRLIISHSDSDHAGGMTGLLNEVAANEVLASSKNKINADYLCLRGQSWNWDGVEFEILQPELKQKGSKNNRSCVLKVTGQHFSTLLTGDIEKETEKSLVEKQNDKLKSDILIVPHHGSKTSSSEAFIKAVSPQIASFSLGYYNAYHFPATEVVSRYREQGVTQLRTDYTGAQQFSWDHKTGLKVIRWRDEDRKIWTVQATE